MNSMATGPAISPSSTSSRGLAACGWASSVLAADVSIPPSGTVSRGRPIGPNFPPEEQIAGDIREIRTTDVPQHDLLLAGFPCQPFSLAGVSKKNSLGRPHGFADETQGTLFFDIARILRDHEPAAFLLENVKHLRNHDRGRTMHVILRTLEEELGYHVTTRVIDARSFLPQHRQRVFIAGIPGGYGLRSQGSGPAGSDEGSPARFGASPRGWLRGSRIALHHGGVRQLSRRNTRSATTSGRISRNMPESTGSGGTGFGFGLVGREDTARTLSARYYKDGSEILIRQDGAIPTTDSAGMRPADGV